MQTINDIDKWERTVRFDESRNSVVLIDQRKLPYRYELVFTKDFYETARAIKDMTVRGAGAIGATAAYGMAQAALSFRGEDKTAFESLIFEAMHQLKSARPTAVDPANAIDFVMSRVISNDSIDDQKKSILAAAHEFAEAQIKQCYNIGLHGAELLFDGMRILTHCNAGALAFVAIGSATAPIYVAKNLGKKTYVFCDETRPRCQGASLTAWELARAGISHEIIVDNCAGYLMSKRQIDAVIVGCDRLLAKTGHIVNKIGTYTKAVLAHRHSIPFYVALPISTIDWQCDSVDLVPIEERDSDEVLYMNGLDMDGVIRRIRIANPGSPARNPAFDITPPDLITAYITPIGVLKRSELGQLKTKSITDVG